MRNAAAVRDELSRLQIEPIDPNDPSRAILYLPELRDTYEYFRDITRNELDADVYRFVSPALHSPNVLNEMARILDFFAAPVLNLLIKEEIEFKERDPDFSEAEKKAILDNYSFEEIYQECFYRNTFDEYKQARDRLLDAYPKIKFIIRKISNNVKTNIILACNRIFDDKSNLERFFLSSDSDSFERLRMIRSSGSDFHKGGKQVLILEFDVATDGSESSGGKIQRVVYKPSDVEMDCLIAGDSQAVNAIHQGFMSASFFELFNRAATEASSSAMTRREPPLPTYKILPLNYFSKHTTTDLQVRNFRDLYGYIEFIEHRESFSTKSGLRSDYCILPNEDPSDAKKRVHEFYAQVGCFAAVAAVLGISDLHIENLIVHKFRPYPIDLEVCLGKPKSIDKMASPKQRQRIEYLAAMSLLGGFAGSINLVLDTKYECRAIKSKRDVQIEIVPHRVRGQNRLYCLPNLDEQPRDLEEDLEPRGLVSPDYEGLLEGVKAAFDVLLAMRNENLIGWWKRVRSTLVRELPVGTVDLQRIRDHVFQSPTQDIGAVLREDLLKLHEEYKSRYEKNADFNDLPPENFELFNIRLQRSDLAAFKDFCELDIPVYYRAVASRDLLDSFGNRIPRYFRDIAVDLLESRFFEDGLLELMRDDMMAEVQKQKPS